MAKAKGIDCQFQVGDAETLPFGDASFDRVICNFGLYHLPGPDRAIAEAARVLRPGGIYVFTTWCGPDVSPLFRVIAEAIQAHGKMHVSLPPAPPPFRLADKPESRRAMAAAGFGEVPFVDVPAVFECPVVDAFKLRRYAVLGISQGAATAIAHAARHPERVSKLILVGGYARGRYRRDSEKESELGKAFLTIMREGWGDENSALFRIFSSAYLPGASPEQIRWFADFQRVSSSAETAIRLRQAVDEIDLSDLLPNISAPSLVMHSRRDNVVPFDEGRRVAASIPNAKFVSLETENHIPIPSEPAWPTLLESIETFLSDPDAAPEPARILHLVRPRTRSSRMMGEQLFDLNSVNVLAALHEARLGQDRQAHRAKGRQLGRGPIPAA